jgi:asparagine synthase (glutamine-hydrolysing)
MCGICGFYRFDGQPASAHVVTQMAETLTHRGPDGSGLFADGPVGLGHTRLKIIDLSDAAKQPMSNEKETLWIVFNGEIYNFKELRRRLQAQGHIFRSQSDTEVLLRLYEELGEKCVQELDGMFAFVIWDKPRRQLFLARDRVGKKPLYYVKNQALFAFGSEVKALLRHPDVPAELSLEVIPHYFSFGYPPPGQTFYRDISQLPPAHTMTVDMDGRIESRCYWDLDLSPRSGKRIMMPEAVEQIRMLLTEAVQKRLVSDVPLGAFLSGGIDSSIVVGLMSRLMDRPVKTFSLGFAGDADFDETKYARLVATHFRTDHTEFIVEPKAIDLIESLIWHHDGPFGDSSAIPTSIVAQLTRQQVTVALNGDGGDELFAGYLRFQACVSADRLPADFSKLCGMVLAALPEPRQYHHWLRRTQRFFAGASKPLFERMQRWISVFNDDLPGLLRPELFEAVLTAGVGYPQDLIAKTAPLSTLSKVLYVNFKTYLPDDLLVKMDRCTMAHGLEGRSPFLDHRLAEFVAGLPDHWKLRWGTTKYILKTAFADMLPGEIIRRGKRGFGVPLGAWFRGDLREYLQDHLLAPTARSRDYLQPVAVEGLIRAHMQGDGDYGHRLWTLLAFELWLHQVASGTWDHRSVLQT